MGMLGVASAVPSLRRVADQESSVVLLPVNVQFQLASPSVSMRARHTIPLCLFILGLHTIERACEDLGSDCRMWDASTLAEELVGVTSPSQASNPYADHLNTSLSISLLANHSRSYKDVSPNQQYDPQRLKYHSPY
jgi:hypothetical protein